MAGALFRHDARRLVGSMAVVAALIGLPSAAGADATGYDANPALRYADSSDHWYCFASSVDASQQAQYDGSMQYLDGATDMTSVKSSVCGTATDIVFTIENRDPSWYGATSCVRHVTWGVCDQYWVAVNQANILVDTAAYGGGYGMYNVNLIKTIRHEIGHTVGLEHCWSRDGWYPDGFKDCVRPIDAMTSQWNQNLDLSWLTYNSHHVAHINAQY